MSAPLITVGMPVRNNAATIRRAVLSIQLQTVTEWEMLLVDDGSFDGTLDVISDLLADARIRVLSDGYHLGIVARLNESLTLARGRYYARMDGDDVSYPDRFERQLDFMQRHSGVDLLGAQVLVIDSHGEPLGERRCPTTHDLICRHPAHGFRMFHPTFFGRSDWFRHHLYTGGRFPSEDQELLLRTHSRSRFANLDMILLGYSQGPIQLGRSLLARWGYVDALRRSPDSGALTTLAAAAEHLLLASWDVGAVGVGRGNVNLRQRQRPTSWLEIERWGEVSRSASSGVGGPDAV